MFLGVLLALVAGAFYVLGYAPFSLWFAPIASLVLYAALLSYKKPWQGFIIGLCFGLGLMCVGISWIYNSISNYSDASSEQAILFVFSFCLFISLFYAVPAYLYCWLNFRKTTIFSYSQSTMLIQIFSFAALWTLSELLRSHLYIGFPWLLLGDSMIDSLLAPWAPIGGGILVSFLVCISALSLLNILKLFPSIYVRRDQYRILGLAILIGVPWAVGARMMTYNWTNPISNPIRVVIVQGNVPQEEKWDPRFADEIINLYKSSSYTNADNSLIVWPEAASPYVHPEARSTHNEISSRMQISDAVLIYGGLRVDEQRRLFNSIFVGGEENRIRKVYDKTILVPFGEYIPLLWLSNYFPNIFSAVDVSDFVTQKGGTPQSFKISFAGMELSFAPSICYEVAYGYYAAKMARDSNLLVSLSNDSWFGDSLGPHQHMHFARMRALENQQYLIRAGNNGITAIVDERGQFAKKVAQFNFEILQGEVTPRRGTTPYQYYRDLPMWILSVLIILICFVRRRAALNYV